MVARAARRRGFLHPPGVGAGPASLRTHLGRRRVETSATTALLVSTTTVMSETRGNNERNPLTDQQVEA